MGDKKAKEDPMNMMKSITRMVDGIVDELMEKKVINGDELQKLGKGVNRIVNGTENLFEDVAEKTQMVGKIFMDHVFSTEKQLRLKFHPKNENDESEKSESSSSSPTGSEDEGEESSDEENAGSARALALPPAAPQEIQASPPNHKLKLCPRDDFHRIRTTMADDIYPVMEREGRTRLALIICNKEFKHLPTRKGSEVDVSEMKDLLENLGYSVVVEENLTALEMETVLWQFAARQEHQSSDSTILVFMTHGILDGLCGTTHKMEEPDILCDDTIFQIFNNRNCQGLRDKPKVLIMQACRGRGVGTTWVADMGDAPECRYNHTRQCYIWSDSVTKTHVEKDFIAFKSSTPHNISWIMEENGSFFISRLIYYIKEYSYCNHLQEIFRKVQHSFETPDEPTQMPTIERVSMTRQFYLFPGI